MPTNHRDEVAELLADYRRSRERLASVQRELLSISESATSPDGLVSAAVDSAGMLSGLAIADQAYRRYRPGELAELIVRTARMAGAQAGARAREALAPVLPPGTDPAAVLAGRGDLTPAELRPRAAPRDSDADDESYEDTSWLGRGR